jgi:hypothetical protein
MIGCIDKVSGSADRCSERNGLLNRLKLTD